MPEAITDVAAPSMIEDAPPSEQAAGGMGTDEASDLFGHWADGPASGEDDDALAVPKMFR